MCFIMYPYAMCFIIYSFLEFVNISANMEETRMLLVCSIWVNSIRKYLFFLKKQIYEFYWHYVIVYQYTTHSTRAEFAVIYRWVEFVKVFAARPVLCRAAANNLYTSNIFAARPVLCRSAANNIYTSNIVAARPVLCRSSPASNCCSPATRSAAGL